MIKFLTRMYFRFKNRNLTDSQVQEQIDLQIEKYNKMTDDMPATHDLIVEREFVNSFRSDCGHH